MKLRLTLDVTYDLEDCTPEDLVQLEHNLEYVVQHAMSAGLITDGTPATVDTYCHGVEKLVDPEEDAPTYRIQRFFEDRDKVSETVEEGLTLAEAKAHCSSPDSEGDGWFDGFEMEG